MRFAGFSLQGLGLEIPQQSACTAGVLWEASVLAIKHAIQLVLAEDRVAEIDTRAATARGGSGGERPCQLRMGFLPKLAHALTHCTVTSNSSSRCLRVWSCLQDIDVLDRGQYL